MGIEELINNLGIDGENAEALRKFISEREKKAKDKLDKVEEKLKTVQKEKESFDGLKSKYENVAKKIGFDIETEDFDAAVDIAIEELKKAAGNPTPDEIAKIKKEINTLRKQNETVISEKAEAEKKYDEVLTKYQGGMIRQALLKALSEANIKDPAFIAEALSGKVKVNEDDTLSFIGNDGAEMEISDGVAEFAKVHPDFISHEQLGGAGSLGAKGTVDKDGVPSVVKNILEGRKQQNTNNKSNFFGN